MKRFNKKMGVVEYSIPEDSEKLKEDLQEESTHPFDYFFVTFKDVCKEYCGILTIPDVINMFVSMYNTEHGDMSFWKASNDEVLEYLEVFKQQFCKG